MSVVTESGVADQRRGGRLPRSARRKQLLIAAQQVFVANGYHAAAMDDIAERAGVSKPVLYQHFPGKLELYLALLETQADLIRAAVTDALTATEDNRQRIHGVLTAYFQFVDSDPEGVGGGYRLLLETDLGNDPAVRERVESVTRSLIDAVADTVANDTGLDRASASLLATALIGAAQVAARAWLEADKQLPQAEAVALLESLFWRGISNFPMQGVQLDAAEAAHS